MNLFSGEIYNADAYQALPIHWAQEWGSMRFEHAKEQVMACGAGSQPDLTSSRFCGIIQHLSLGSTGTDTLKSVPSFESLIAEAMNLIKSKSFSQSTSEQNIKEVVPQISREEKLTSFRSFPVMKLHKFRKDTESKWIAWLHKLPRSYFLVVLVNMSEQVVSTVLSSAGHEQTCQPNDILDLEQLDPGGDDFTWLYASPSVSNNGADVVAWLRSESGSLSFETKRSLLDKLESLQAHHSFASMQNGIETGKQKAQNGDLFRVHSATGCEQQPSEPLRVEEFKDAQDHSDLFLVNGLSSPLVNSTPTRNLIAAKNVYSESPSSSETSSADVSGLSSNLKDVQLLASIQEDDLRQCLENLKLSRRRATVPDSATTNVSRSPFLDAKRSPRDSTAIDNSTSKEIPKLGGRHASAPCNDGFLRKHSANGSKSFNVEPTRSTPPSSARLAVPKTCTYSKRGMSVHPRYPGLQKSLPNLSIVRMMEANSGRSKNPDTNEAANGTMSPNELNQSSTSLDSKGGHVPPKIAKTTRQPSRLPMPVRTGIPLLKSSLRKNSSNDGLPPLTISKNSWNEGCF
ncbi:Putative transcriptional regulator [Trichuris trichiura]|uniref:Putative transcriptional regulator n=1 Tax=Trichuris trichiura TaxID=36087 RepID=A0A077ZAQ7_TRITR|nr:Putative transcriptional regulator [Trichuris trichiura]